mmetsp:Transcript_23740/g.35286  ORF Transcript_23740/g.35286 Transcript_23740/m.35286 type:complete len:151 (-) Transcript_23740:294-746(-)
MDGGQALTHRQMPAAEESAEISSDTPKGRILPSSTADVKAAIAAIQARSAALRKHNTELTSSMNDGRINVSRRRQPVESRQTFSGSDSDDSDDDDDDDDDDDAGEDDNTDAHTGRDQSFTKSVSLPSQVPSRLPKVSYVSANRTMRNPSG